MASSRTMTAEIGSVSDSTPTPARTSTFMISSVAYATEESASDEKTASALTLVSRSCDSRAVGIGVPRTQVLDALDRACRRRGGLARAGAWDQVTPTDA